MKSEGPIGVFDSGYGGLTILESIRTYLPQYDYLYLGDNARTPYGSRSYEVVYQYSLQCVKYLFEAGCHLVIIACNTASAKALRTIQQVDLPKIDPARRVLGIIRPTVEKIGTITNTKHVGLLATQGTVLSGSYPLEIRKINPEIIVTSEPCPMWVPLIENNEHNTSGADFFIKKNLENLMNLDNDIDTVILGCTHYPLIQHKIQQFLSDKIRVISQGELVAVSLQDYLKRHPEMDIKCRKNGKIKYLTTESANKFSESAAVFLQHNVFAEHVTIS